MKEKPILFSGEMVRAILDGRKMQTRRVIKPQPDAIACAGHCPGKDAEPKLARDYLFVDEEGQQVFVESPYAAGQVLWVRETWWHHESPYLEQAGFKGGAITKLESVISGRFRANEHFDPTNYPHLWCKRPSIHMPRWASRITLEVIDVRVERIRDISEGDCIAEGCPPEYLLGQNWFKALWDSLNAKRGFGWDMNPWCWVIEFKRIGEGE